MQFPDLIIVKSSSSSRRPRRSSTLDRYRSLKIRREQLLARALSFGTSTKGHFPDKIDNNRVSAWSLILKRAVTYKHCTLSIKPIIEHNIIIILQLMTAGLKRIKNDEQNNVTKGRRFI